MRNEIGKTFTKCKFYFLVAVGSAIFGAAIYAAMSGKITTTVSAQQDPFLSQRISQLETRLSRLETESRRSAALPLPAPRPIGGSETEVRFLRSQIESLQLRLAGLECGIVKLDERTLTSAARQARRKPAADLSERCRAKPNEPLQ